MTRVVTWNVNSIKTRVGVVRSWLKSNKPDVLLMQEIKCRDSEFPRREFEDLGYKVETAGQRIYNGIAILSRAPLRVEHRRLPGNPKDDQARYIEAVIELPTKGKRRRPTLRVASIYLPNGNPAGSESFAYKIDWMMRLIRHARELLKEEEVLVLGGDYNVAPTDTDVYDPIGWANDALCRPETRAKFGELLNLGFTDVIASRHPEPGNHVLGLSSPSLAQNYGWRIDHLLLSAQALRRSPTEASTRSRGERTSHPTTFPSGATWKCERLPFSKE
jgi:exodeoxyribonuclease-3